MVDIITCKTDPIVFTIENLPSIKSWIANLTKEETKIFNLNKQDIFNIIPDDPKNIYILTNEVAEEFFKTNRFVTVAGLMKADSTWLKNIYLKSEAELVLKKLSHGLSKTQKRSLLRVYQENFKKEPTTKKANTSTLTTHMSFVPENGIEFLLQEVLKLDENQIFYFVRELLGRKNKKVLLCDNEKKNYILSTGVGPICIVAHMDTVRKTTDYPVKLFEQKVIDKNDQLVSREIYNISGILGGDDRSGIAIALYLAIHTDVPVLFTNYEEIYPKTQKGVGVFTSRIDKFPIPEVRLFVELDRKGTNHFALYHNIPFVYEDWFKDTIKLTSIQTGSYSDIKTLTEKYKIPSINLASGFTNPHTAQEKLNLGWWYWTIETVINIIKNRDTLPAIPAGYIPVEKTNYKSDTAGYNSTASVGSHTGVACPYKTLSSLLTDMLIDEKLYSTFEVLTAAEMTKMWEDPIVRGAMIGAVCKYGTKKKK